MDHSKYNIREIDSLNDAEVDWVTKYTMETILETVPEFENNPKIVLEKFPNFTFSQMRIMITNDLPKSNHKLLVVENESNIVGHSIFSIKKDEKGLLYGFCFSRYIEPSHRKKGLASQLLDLAEKWWVKNKVNYAIAHTHIENYKLRNLFLKKGFSLSEPKDGNGYQYFLLHKSYQ